jgi:hypothetical protein
MRCLESAGASGAAAAAFLACTAVAALGVPAKGSDRAALARLVTSSPAISNAGQTRRHLCFAGGRIDGAPPTQPGAAPQPPETIDPASCPSTMLRAAAICLRGTAIRITTPGPAQRVDGDIAGGGQRRAFTAIAVGSAGTTWQARLRVQGIVTRRRQPGELSIGVEYAGAHAAWTAPLRLHKRSC